MACNELKRLGSKWFGVGRGGLEWDRVGWSGLERNSTKPEVLRFYWYFLISYFEVLSRLATREAARVYQFITNNHASFHFWWKENLLNHQKVSKYYEHDCRQEVLSWTDCFDFFDKIYSKKIFSIQNRKSESHDRIQHVWICLYAKFYVK